MSLDDNESARLKMVQSQLEARGIKDSALLDAMRKVPRHLFVPESEREFSYTDRPIPIGSNQTISQPFVVALMLEELVLKPSDKVLEIGTGSGYQTALLAELVNQVYTIELYDELLECAQAVLHEQAYTNIKFRCGDGYLGWSEYQPFDVIVVSAAPENIPRELVRQLAVDGRMILPLGTDDQTLVYLQKTAQGLESRDLGAVRFVPLRQTD